MDKSNSKKLRKSEIKIPFLKKLFTALDFIKTLRRLIQFFPEELALLFPERVYKFKLTDLSIYWGFSSSYLANLKYMYNKKPKSFKVDQEKIDDLELIIKKRLGVKSLICLSIFKKYREGQINFWEFIERLRLELGRVSGEVEITNVELNEIFGFRHKVKEKEKPGDLVYIFDETRISKGYYYLMIDRNPIDIFSLMINSYPDSLKRKRPRDAHNQFVIHKKPNESKKKKESKTQRNKQTNLSSEYPNAYINTEYPNPLIDRSENEEEDLNEALLWQLKKVRDDIQERKHLK